jgi:lipoprotein-anchoring transpeptidase ErfK/SrfK
MIMLAAGFLMAQPVSAQNKIIVSKSKLRLYVVSPRGDTLCNYPCAVGKYYGDKKKPGDYRTPEGTFKVIQIQDSRTWKHDFLDGYGNRDGAYGPRFIRLSVPGFTGIGIHGTCFPESIGSRCTEGCVRLLNDDVMKLISYVEVNNTVCVIEKDMMKGIPKQKGIHKNRQRELSVDEDIARASSPEP